MPSYGYLDDNIYIELVRLKIGTQMDSSAVMSNLQKLIQHKKLECDRKNHFSVLALHSP